MEAELKRLARRIERLAVEPEQVRDAVGWLAGPLLRALRWQPLIEVEHLKALMGPGPHRASAYEVAADELSRNIDSVERACVVHGRPPPSYLAWLSRAHRALSRAHAAREAPVPIGDPSIVLAPLVLREGAAASEVSVGTVDLLLDAARAEDEMLARRRCLLEAARRVLIDAAAAMPLDPRGVARRHLYLASEIAYIDRLEAAGVSPAQGLAHQLRRALDRGERARLHAVIGALDSVAARTGDAGLARLTERAIEILDPGRRRQTAGEVRRSLERSGHELFGAEAIEAVDRGLGKARRKVRARAERAEGQAKSELEAFAARLGPDALRQTVAAALHVDGAFDVGGVMSPVRVEEEILRLRTVAWPTEELVLAQARQPSDVPDAVIEDPRAILYHLASGKLLARRYVAERREKQARSVLASEVRVYLVDGSSSMIGPRGRMRDAILLAELATTIRRLDAPERYVRPVVYYQYFTRKRGPMHRVADRERAVRAITDVLGTVRTGGTNIQGALLSAFERVRLERERDPDLARAQIVLVTDGDAHVDLDAVRAARAELGQLPTRVSVIALGEENVALRTLAAEQRRRGESAFYHYLDDEQLRALVEGRPDPRLFVHLPGDDAPLPGEIAEIVDDIEALARGRDVDALEDLQTQVCALDEVGLSLEVGMVETERAKLEAAHRDERALVRRFDRWFPEPGEAASPAPLRGSAEAEELELARALLGAVAEVVELTGSSPLRRRADAIEIMERLLFDAGLPPWRWQRILTRHATHLRAELETVRAAALMRG
ncbi:MAG: hypothetical protein IT378_13285 [Sandaracinaceae bacterium]|nr:hypothetical protein [Sandaracinaceae bacterium]